MIYSPARRCGPEILFAQSRMMKNRADSPEAQPSRVQLGLGGFWPGFVAIKMHVIVGSFPAITLLFETNKTSTNIH